MDIKKTSPEGEVFRKLKLIRTIIIDRLFKDPFKGFSFFFHFFNIH